MTTWATASTTQWSRLDKGLLMIDDAIAENCVSEIAKLSPFGKEVISYEIQDDFQFVLLSVVTDGVSDVSPEEEWGVFLDGEFHFGGTDL